MPPEQKAKLSLALRQKAKSPEHVAAIQRSRHRLVYNRGLLHVRLLALLQILSDRIPIESPVLFPLVEEVSRLLKLSKLDWKRPT